MEVVSVNRIEVYATPEELRKIADVLEQWWDEEWEKNPQSSFFTSIIGDNARVDFYCDPLRMADKYKP